MKPPSHRFIFLAAACAFAFLLGGCVYVRLLQLKNQLAEADKHFQMDATNGVRIDCLHPILLGDDVRWLGIEPETIGGTPEAETWRVRWIKETPPDVTETTIYDVELAAAFTKKKLSQVYIPEKYFAFFPKDLFVNLLRSTGTAKIDRTSRQADVNAGTDPAKPAIPMPKISEIEGMLGVPTEKKVGKSEITYRYRYRAVTTVAKAKPIEVSFIFDDTTGNLRKLIGKLPKGVINYDLSTPPAKSPKKESGEKSDK